MSALRRVGWGSLRLHYPERGPVGDTWLDADQVVAVEAHRPDAHYRQQSKIHLRNGSKIVVFGTPDEVLRCLSSDPSQTSASVDAVPADRAPEVSAQQGTDGEQKWLRPGATVDTGPLTVAPDLDAEQNHVLTGVAANGEPVTVRVPCDPRSCPVCAAIAADQEGHADGPPCSSCGGSIDSPPCTRNPATGQGGHTVAGGVGAATPGGAG